VKERSGMSNSLTLDELKQAGVKLPKEFQKGSLYKEQIDSYAMKIVGLVADAPNNNVRRKAVDKARRMIGTR